MNRIARASLCFVISAALVLAGCSTSWIKTALADLPVITQVALNIASIVAAAQGKGQAGAAVTTQIQNISSQVKSDLTLVQNLIDTYQSAPAASRATLLTQISTSLADAQTNLKSILTAVHVDNAALQATIVAAVGVAVTTLVSIESLIPAPKGTVNASAPIKPPSSSQLKREFNAIFVANGFPQAQVK